MSGSYEELARKAMNAPGAQAGKAQGAQGISAFSSAGQNRGLSPDTPGAPPTMPQNRAAGAPQVTTQAVSQNAPQVTTQDTQTPPEAGSPTTYQDANGQTQNGYILNGHVYQDPYGQNAMPVGSLWTSQTGGGSWYMGENGGFEVFPVQYRTADGQTKTGYMVNGRLSADPYGAAIPTGAAWTGEDGKNYVMTGVGAVPAIGSQYEQEYFAALGAYGGGANDQSELLRRQYEQALEASRAAALESYQSGLSDLEAERRNAEALYREQLRQTQAESDRSQRAFFERQNAYGLSSGARAQAALSMGNQNQANLTTIRTAEAAQQQELQRQRISLGRQYQSAIQQAIAQNNSELASALYQEAVRLDEALQEQQSAQAGALASYYQQLMGYNREDQLNQEERDYQDRVSEQERAYNWALAMLKLGSMPSDEMLQAAGLTREDAQRYLNARKSGGGSSGGSGGSGSSGKTEDEETTGTAAGAITDTSQLSQWAFANLYHPRTDVRSQEQYETYSAQIVSAYEAGRITQAEAAFLLRAMGYQGG